MQHVVVDWLTAASLVVSTTTTVRAELPAIDISYFNVHSFACNGFECSTPDPISVLPPFFPHSGLHEVVISPSYSRHRVNLSIVGNQYILSFDLDQVSDGPSSYGSLSTPEAYAFADLILKPTIDMPFEFYGFYNVTDFALDGPAVSGFSADITDYTASKSVFESYQTSAATSNAHYTIGQPGGDRPHLSGRPNLLGSAKGILLAGHEYGFIFNAYLATSPPFGDYEAPGASAVGKFIIKIGASNVPEPSTTASFALVGLAVVLVRRRY